MKRMSYIHLKLHSLSKKKSIEQVLQENHCCACLEYINEQNKFAILFAIFCDNDDSENNDDYHHHYKNS